MERPCLRGMLFAAALLVSAAAFAQSPCAPTGAWTIPGRGTVPAAELLARTAKEAVVLVGEQHDNADHHRWQLQTVAALAALNSRVAIGFEAFPRRVQPALDRWITGELNEEEFLQASEWRQVWGFDPALYLPLFHFARLNRIPMFALNVEQSLVRAVRASGFAGVPADKREGVTRPAPASEAYRDRLFRTYLEHVEKGKKGARTDPEFSRFVEAQLLWDRAMAQALAERSRPDTLVIGILGSGHIVHGHGVEHQLRDLGVSRVASLLPWSANDDCKTLATGLASAVFALPPARPGPPPQLLGITVGASPEGVRISAVGPGSVAEKAGLRAGDVLLEVAGAVIKDPSQVRPLVQSVGPGTWLPLKLMRQGEQLELVARFPRRSK